MRFVLAIVAFVVAAVMIVAGIAQRTIFAPPSQIAVSATVGGDARYIVIDSAVLNAHPGQQTLSLAGAPDAKTQMVAYGRTADVKSWLGDQKYAAVSYRAGSGDLTVKTVTPKASTDSGSTDGSTATPAPTDTPTPAATAGSTAVATPGPDPAGSDLWLEEYDGQDAQLTKMNVPSGVSVIIQQDTADLAGRHQHAVGVPAHHRRPRAAGHRHRAVPVGSVHPPQVPRTPTQERTQDAQAPQSSEVQADGLHRGDPARPSREPPHARDGAGAARRCARADRSRRRRRVRRRPDRHADADADEHERAEGRQPAAARGHCSAAGAHRQADLGGGGQRRRQERPGAREAPVHRPRAAAARGQLRDPCQEGRRAGAPGHPGRPPGAVAPAGDRQLAAHRHGRAQTAERRGGQGAGPARSRSRAADAARQLHGGVRHRPRAQRQGPEPRARQHRRSGGAAGLQAAEGAAERDRRRLRRHPSQRRQEQVALELRSDGRQARRSGRRVVEAAGAGPARAAVRQHVVAHVHEPVGQRTGDLDGDQRLRGHRLGEPGGGAAAQGPGGRRTGDRRRDHRCVERCTATSWRSTCRRPARPRRYACSASRRAWCPRARCSSPNHGAQWPAARGGAARSAVSC